MADVFESFDEQMDRLREIRDRFAEISGEGDCCTAGCSERAEPGKLHCAKHSVPFSKGIVMEVPDERWNIPPESIRFTDGRELEITRWE